jgi:hypothetical protein
MGREMSGAAAEYAGMGKRVRRGEWGMEVRMVFFCRLRRVAGDGKVNISRNDRFFRGFHSGRRGFDRKFFVMVILVALVYTFPLTNLRRSAKDLTARCIFVRFRAF